MPSIAKIRFTNVIYEGGAKRYNDDIFWFDGHNGIILLENSGGKTVFIQTAIQAVLPHQDLADRKVKDTLMLQGASAHVAIEWILNEQPRRYALTAVTLYLDNDQLQSHRYVYEYEAGDPESIENLPFVRESEGGALRPASQGEMADYYQQMAKKSMLAQKFNDISSYHQHLEENFKIIPKQWKRIVAINGAEGDVEGFFKGCSTTEQLVNRLLIPTVEEALAGDGTLDFVELFNQQRVHFKEYRRLKKQLEENQNIEKQVQIFVDQYQKLDMAQKMQWQFKQKAKAFYNLTKQAMRQNQQQQKSLNDTLYQVQEDEKTRERQEKSLEIRELEQARADIQVNYDQVKEEFYDYQKQLLDTQKRYQWLEIALIKQKIKQQEQNIDNLRLKLLQLEQNPTVVELQSQLKIVRRQMKGYFLAKERQINNALGDMERQWKSKQTDEKELKRQIKQLGEEKGEIQKQLGILEEKIKSATTAMADFKLEIFIGVDQGSVEAEIPKLEEQTKQLAQEIDNCVKALGNLDREKDDLKGLIEQEQNSLKQVAAKASAVTQKLKNITRQQKQLMMQLEQKSADFARYHSLYTGKASITTQVAEKNSQLTSEVENLLRQERLAFRFLDDYQDSNIFTADPLLEKLIQGWQGQFSSLESGTTFIARAMASGIGPEINSQSWFPFWSLTVITAEQETAKLLQKIQLQRDKITYPVFVISTGEARSILDGAKVDLTVVEPSIWQHNIDANQFAVWKQKLQSEAVAVQEQRKKQTENQQGWLVLQENLASFYQSYPFEEFNMLSHQQIELEEQKESLDKQVKHYRQQLDKTEQQIKLFYKQQRNAEQHNEHVVEKLKFARQYMEQKAKLEQAQIDNYRLEQKKKDNQNECNAYTDRLTRLDNAMGRLKDGIYDLKQQRKMLQRDENYIDVQQDTGLLPIDTDLLLPALLDRKKTIDAQLSKEQISRQNIVEQLDESQKEIRALKSDLEHKKINAGFDIEQKTDDVILNQGDLIKLAELSKQIEQQMAPVAKAYKQLEKSLENNKATLEIRLKDYQKSFHPHQVEVFYDPLPLVREKLAKWQQNLKEQQKQLAKDLANLNKEYILWEQLERNLLTKNGDYGYLAEEVEPAILEGGLVTNYAYRYQQIWDDLFKQLADSEQKKQRETSVVALKRQQLIDYCHQYVQDVRMRKDVKAGLMHKENYAEIKEWHGLMQNRINRTKNIIENDLKNHNVELEHFVAYLHNYLRQIKEELEQIPKKTRVKVDDKWKDVYIFKVPDWPEEEGKESIRNQIFWMLKKLEDAAYKDENGRENETMILQDITGWLQTKQMLRVVMKNQKISVQCRKVSNDGKVGGGLHSWRESNKWSMGERWSKNMTLFLGVLNYLAEKRQHIHHHVKLNSSVIMDNPFGQASSDHVLDPVFFIAGQLGFQMIALTAHTGGNFIRNYFPVVYSCRLRPAEGSDKLIMTKEKELKKAYFQDHNPQVLNQLGTVEQISLF